MATSIINIDNLGEALNEKMDRDLHNSTVLKSVNGIVSVINPPPSDSDGNEVSTMGLSQAALKETLKSDGSNASAKTGINIAHKTAELPAKTSDSDELHGVDIGITYIAKEPYWGITYVAGCDNMYYAPAKMNFADDTFYIGDWGNAFFVKNCKPCALKYDGTVDYYLDINDYTKKEDGTASMLPIAHMVAILWSNFRKCLPRLSKSAGKFAS